QRVVTLWTRKRKDGNLEPDAMPINTDLFNVLWRRWTSRTQNDWVFFNDKTNDRYNRRPKFMKGLCKRAGIPYIGFHSIRHFMASFLADKQKISLMTISKLLRHRSLNTTEIYLHSIGEGQRAAMDGIEGLFSASGFASASELKSSRNN
ncbi:tyrosine-type recombinase/integrase, partial [Desulfococcus sp.]|uniref:tyrosine-type recombinase/integrase n=1 Tax=Desulfococcus sp. TaxID=2025834 RepID=UPI00359416FE